MSWRKQYGYTLVELMIAIAILAILANVALPAYLNYSTRAKVGASIILASGVKAAVGEHYSTTATFPASNSQAGAPDPETITSEYVNSVSIEVDPETGAISINYTDFGPITEGDAVVLVPADCSGSIRWACITEDISDTYVPPACRGTFDQNDPCLEVAGNGNGNGQCGGGGNCSGGGDDSNPGGGGNESGTNNPGKGQGNGGNNGKGKNF